MSQQLPESSEKTKQQTARQETQPAPTKSFEAGLHPILQLHRTLGNQRIAQVIKARRLTPKGRIIGLQPKLTVGAADDQYEQEADHVARQVVSMPDSTVLAFAPQTSPIEGDTSQAHTLQSKPLPLAASITPFVQRQMGTEEESEEDQNREEDKKGLLQAKFFNKSTALPLQRQTATEEKETEEIEPIQARSAGSMSDSFEAGDDVESRLNQSKGGGSQLPDSVRAFMEPRFGVDFNHVRVHTGSEAVQMNRDVGAQAFTHGADIYYGAGSSPGNLELTAHELTHVVQQTEKENLRLQRQDSELRITTATFARAPRGPNTRHIIGVGEGITFTANHRGTWEIPGVPASDHRRTSQDASWSQPGTYTATVRTPRSSASVEIQVVAPSILINKLRDIEIPIREGVGVGMHLEGRLTPLEVSYAGLEFREEDCSSSRHWGYYDAHRELAIPHDAIDNWPSVDHTNKVSGFDTALIVFRASTMPWPLTPGGFSWAIPDSYRIGNTSYRFASNMIETFAINPTAPSPPYTGSATIWKGGQTATRDY
jgi:hypothetical protein